MGDHHTMGAREAVAFAASAMLALCLVLILSIDGDGSQVSGNIREGISKWLSARLQETDHPSPRTARVPFRAGTALPSEAGRPKITRPVPKHRLTKKQILDEVLAEKAALKKVLAKQKEEQQEEKEDKREEQQDTELASLVKKVQVLHAHPPRPHVDDEFSEKTETQSDVELDEEEIEIEQAEKFREVQHKKQQKILAKQKKILEARKKLWKKKMQAQHEVHSTMPQGSTTTTSSPKVVTAHTQASSTPLVLKRTTAQAKSAAPKSALAKSASHVRLATIVRGHAATAEAPQTTKSSKGKAAQAKVAAHDASGIKIKVTPKARSTSHPSKKPEASVRTATQAIVMEPDDEAAKAVVEGASMSMPPIHQHQVEKVKTKKSQEVPMISPIVTKVSHKVIPSEKSVAEEPTPASATSDRDSGHGVWWYAVWGTVAFLCFLIVVCVIGYSCNLCKTERSRPWGLPPKRNYG